MIEDKVLKTSRLLLLLICGVGIAAVVFLFVTFDHRYATSAPPVTDSSRAYLYAVDPQTNKVLTYSVVPGDIKLVGNGFNSVAGHSASTMNDKPAAVIIISNPQGDVQQSIAGRQALPRLVWKDAETRFQQQFFQKGQIVYVSDQPLKYDEDYILAHLPATDSGS